MAEASTTVETPPKAKQNRAVLNQAQVQELTKSEQIGRCAKKAAYADLLAQRDITAALVDQLLADIIAARTKASSAMGSTTDKESATVDEDTAEGALLKALQEVQAAAKQKYARNNPTQLQKYYVGKRLDASRDDLEQYSQGIINALASDTLPGITPAKVAALAPLRQAYIDADDDQGGDQSAATTQREELKTMIKSITDRRISIQFAADGQWPWSNPSNAGIRKEFYLPANQPFNA